MPRPSKTHDRPDMGSSLSKAQYSYKEPRRKKEYFRRCESPDCFCGAPHIRERHVSFQQGAGGMDPYPDPEDVLYAILSDPGDLYDLPPSLVLPPFDALSRYYTPSPPPCGLIGTLPSMPSPAAGFAEMMAAVAQAGNRGWPGQGFKDPLDWTTRELSGFKEVMDECTSRERGRFMLDRFAPYQMPSKGMPFMDTPWNSGGPPSHPHTQGTAQPENSQMYAQMARYAQTLHDLQAQMQSTNDLLYGTEREQREELYLKRQSKFMQDMLQAMHSSGRPAGPGGQPHTETMPHGMPMNAPPAPMMHPSMMSTPYFMQQGQPMMGMPHTYPAGADPLSQYATMEAMRQQSRRARPHGFGDGFEDEFGSRRNARHRPGFDEMDNGPMGPPFPEQPPRPTRPRPSQDGGGAAFEPNGRTDQHKPGQRSEAYPSQGFHNPNEIGMPPSDGEHGQESRRAGGAEQGRYSHSPQRFDRYSQPPMPDDAQQRPHVGFDRSADQSRPTE